MHKILGYLFKFYKNIVTPFDHSQRIISAAIFIFVGHIPFIIFVRQRVIILTYILYLLDDRALVVKDLFPLIQYTLRSNMGNMQRRIMYTNTSTCDLLFFKHDTSKPCSLYEVKTHVNKSMMYKSTNNVVFR